MVKLIALNKQIHIKLLCSTALALFFLLQTSSVSASEEISENPNFSSENIHAFHYRELDANIPDFDQGDIEEIQGNETSPNTSQLSINAEKKEGQASLPDEFQTSDNQESAQTIFSDQDILPLTRDSAKLISEGKITLENNQYDYSLLGKPSLEPDADDDKDGLQNKDEIYIYKKNNKSYIGYKSHPRLDDSDGDGLLDSEDDQKKQWYVTDRDLAFFMELSYRDDFYIDKVLNESQPLYDIYENRDEYRIMHKELAPFWRVVKTYHTSNGLDAVLFGTFSKLPYLQNKNNSTHILAFRGTQANSLKDWYTDSMILFGGNPLQAKDAEHILSDLAKDSKIQNLYVTGHSLGGYLAQRFAASAYKQFPHFYTKCIRNIVTFNSPKVFAGKTLTTQANGLWEASLISKQLAEQGKLKHYIANNDHIITGSLRQEESLSFNIGYSPFAHGSRYYVTNAVLNNNYNSHFSIGKRDWSTAPEGYSNPQLSLLIYKDHSYHNSTHRKTKHTKQMVIPAPVKNHSLKNHTKPKRGVYSHRRPK